MRMFFTVSFLVLLSCGLHGCSSGNQGKAEKIMDQMIEEMNKLTTALENGDKSAVDKSISSIVQLGTQAKGIKVKQSENDAIKKKFEGKLKDVQTRMTEAVKKSLTNGKFSPQDMIEIGNKLKDVGESMKMGS